jgi:histidine transport system permease protein
MFEPLLPVAAHFMTSLLGYGPLLLQGIWLTLKLALLSLLLGLVFGLIGACAKLSRVWGWRFSAQLYTTLIRGVPDLLLMLLIFYGLQTGLSRLTNALEWAYIEIDPFSAGVITLGFVYGAYFTETFRGGLAGGARWASECCQGIGPDSLAGLCVCGVPADDAVRFARPLGITGWSCSRPRRWYRSLAWPIW